MNLKVYILYSGSGGNSAFIKMGESTILIDAGKSARALCTAINNIGEDIQNVDAIFVTHEHSDHVSALEIISKKYHIPIYMTEISARKFDSCPNAAIHSCLNRRGVDFCEQIGSIRVSSFRTPHDSNMSVGYKICFEKDGKCISLGYATDIGYVSPEVRENLSGCDAVVLESNHDVDMLWAGPYPQELKQRVASNGGHLSNAECAKLASELACSGTRAFMLAHLSAENNEPDIAREAVSGAIYEYGARLFIARPDEPVEFELNFFEEK